MKRGVTRTSEQGRTEQGISRSFVQGDTAGFKTWDYIQGILHTSADYNKLDYFHRITRSWIPNAEPTVVRLFPLYYFTLVWKISQWTTLFVNVVCVLSVNPGNYCAFFVTGFVLNKCIAGLGFDLMCLGLTIRCLPLKLCFSR